MKAKKIGLICSMEFETELLKENLRHKHEPIHGITTGRIGKNQLTISVAGMGQVNSAIAVMEQIEHHKPDVLINFGICGAYHGSGFEVGDVLVAESETYADLGVLLPAGPQGMEELGYDLIDQGKVQSYETFVTDKRLSVRARKLATDSGLFLTVSMATGTDERAKELQARFPQAVCENMEGAAIAHVALVYGIPFIEIRGISNMVEKRNLKRWKKNKAALNCQKVLLEFLELV